MVCKIYNASGYKNEDIPDDGYYYIRAPEKIKQYKQGCGCNNIEENQIIEHFDGAITTTNPSQRIYGIIDTKFVGEDEIYSDNGLYSKDYLIEEEDLIVDTTGLKQEFDNQELEKNSLNDRPVARTNVTSTETVRNVNNVNQSKDQEIENTINKIINENTGNESQNDKKKWWNNWWLWLLLIIIIIVLLIVSVGVGVYVCKK